MTPHVGDVWAPRSTAPSDGESYAALDFVILNANPEFVLAAWSESLQRGGHSRVFQLDMSRFTERKEFRLVRGATR